MSKRAQERMTEEEPVVAKIKASEFDIMSANQSPMLDSGTTYSRRITDWIGILISQALRGRCEPESKTHRQVLKCGTEVTVRFQALGDWCER